MGYKPIEGAAFNPLKQFPRNMPCFCGSGKKFKKCHLDLIPNCIPQKEVDILNKYKDDIFSGKIKVQPKESA